MTVISVENLSKSYTLGQIGTGTFSHDLAVWWARARGKPNPLLRIGETDHGNRVGEEIWALKDVSFQVQQGEVLGVIGKNGAGKSTLLKILSRVTAPTSGEVKVKGRIASLLEVGTGFHPELTGRENIYLNGAILGMSKQEVTRKFDEIVDFSGVEKFIDTPVKRYSSGMYVRLAFAVAAHLESEILLVDEVLAVGDAEFQKKCLGKMGDVAHNEGRTVLFVSHNMAAIEHLCTRTAIINDGHISLMAETSEAIKTYNIAIDGKKYILDSNIFEITTKGHLCSDKTDDVIIEIMIQMKNQDLQDFQFDLAVKNENGIKVIKLQTNQIRLKYDLKREKFYKFTLRIIKPNLSPGIFYLDLFIFNSIGRLGYISNIPLLNVTPKMVARDYNINLDKLGIIVPEFSINVESSNEYN